MSSRPQPRRQIKAAGRKHQTSSSPQARKHIHTHQAASIYNAQGRKHIVRARPQAKRKRSPSLPPRGGGADSTPLITRNQHVFVLSHHVL